VNIEVSTVKDVLRIPNAALRFRPTQGLDEAKNGHGGGHPAQPSPGGPTPEQRVAHSERRPGLEGAAAALEGGKRAQGGKGMQTVYLLAGKNEIKPAKVRTGISDGKFTAILEGDVRPGDKIVIGQATAKVEGTARPPGGGGRPF
jgi:HlyD family secretion protein